MLDMAIEYSKLSNYKIKKILKKFCLELTSVQTAEKIH